uniref:Secreted protein n=1 Tax=Caenorhabditis tropicalis TaxID=1561998 RepID=A0A1I7TN15_9PELO
MISLADDLPVAHLCSHSEIVQVSNTVSDLLTHRKDSGSFLRSYYLLTYACSSEGQEILSKHRECLKSEKIGEMTLSAGTYLSEKFLEHSKEDVCDKVNEKLQQYISALGGLCSKNEAAQLMCQSLKNMFTGLHADKLDNCKLDCKIPADTSEESKEEVQLTNDAQDDENLEQTQSEHDALRPADSSSIAFSFFSIVLFALLR